MEVTLELVRVAVSLDLAHKDPLAAELAMFVLSATTSIKAVLVLDAVPKCKGLTFR
jgi:hypothetical protein